MSVQCARVVQRNWSRVAIGEIRAGAGAGERVFLKQYVDAGGTPHEDHWASERDGTIVAERVLGKALRVPGLRGGSADSLLNAFQYRELVSLDVLLREQPERLARCFVAVIEKMVDVLDALERGVTSAAARELAVKERSYGSARKSLNFKGLDIRNVGVESGSDLTFVMFDFGRPYLAPISEAAAKLLVSVGLLNWGKPVRRFLRGPDEALLDIAFRGLAPYVEPEAIAAELELQQRFRSREPKGRDLLTRTLKKGGINSIGRVYFSKLAAWFESRLPGSYPA